MAPQSSPLVPSREARLVRSLSTAGLARRWQDELGIDVAPFFRDVSHLEEWECPVTGLVFFRPLISGDTAGLYSSLHRHPWYYEGDKWEFRWALERLPSSSRVLDIGCGNGAFVALARSAGHRAEGIESNPSAVEAARRAGLAVSNEPLAERAARLPAAVDAVCAFQVLEHVDDPVAFFALVRRLARPGGRILISVPCSGGWLGRAGSVLDAPPHHLTRWTTRALEHLGRQQQCRLVGTTREPLRRAHVGDFVRAWLAPVEAPDRFPPRPGPLRRGALKAVRLVIAGARLNRLLPGHTMAVEFEVPG